MANGVRPVKDIFGLGELANAIRQNREEKRVSAIDAANKITQGLQQENLRLGIQGKRESLADLAAGRREKADLQTAIGADTGKSDTMDAINFLKTRNPERAQKLIDGVFTTAGEISKINAQEGINHVNRELGVNWKLAEETPETILIDKGDEKVLINKSDGSTVKTFSVSAKPKTDRELTPQQKAFASLTPEQQAATFFKSGQTIEIDKDGKFKITSGGTTKPASIQQQKLDEKQRQDKIKAEKRTNQAISKTNIVLGKVDEALENIGLFTTGLGGAVSGVIPGTAARDLQGSIDTIKANLAFQALQDMREASPTGGALGAVSERELNLLESTITSLDRSQSPERIRENLGQIKQLFEKTKQNLDVAESFRRQGLDPNNLTEEQLRTQAETGVKIVIPNHPTHGDVTDADIKKTMEDTGLSEDEVLQALGVK